MSASESASEQILGILLDSFSDEVVVNKLNNVSVGQNVTTKEGVKGIVYALCAVGGIGYVWLGVPRADVKHVGIRLSDLAN